MKITFNDGTEYNKVRLIYERSGQLRVKFFKNVTADEIKSLFRDKEDLTCKITLVGDGKTLEFHGYTVFEGITEYADGIREVLMSKGAETLADRLEVVESGLAEVGSEVAGAEADITNVQNDVDDCMDAIAELGEIVGGE